ncbi:MAG: Gfo/Idh/MocA family oxidoreductase [Pedosphaera sp.]|nr:Gfo/Idh/MocA family oxidoreductase [Pedosphaera sp.]MSU43336.1 Gfo/Idh/MocA family oxidoreductase [Pedosphaera sp.]
MNTHTPTQSDVTRRDFLKTACKTAAAGAAISQLPVERLVHAAPSDTVTVALIGCGGRGSGAASQALSTEGPIRLVAVADAFKDRLESSLNGLKRQFDKKVEVGEEQKFVGMNAYKEAIKLADVVILTTPPGFRPYHFAEAVKQGKHVFMEKPVAADAHGVRIVLEAAQEAKRKGLKVGVGLQRHHQAGYIETINRLQDGELGDITSMRSYWNGGGVWDPRRTRDQVKSELEYQLQNWYYYVWLSGDHICEQHIHNLDVINWVKGFKYPVAAQGMGGRQVRVDKKYGEIFDHHFVEFEYADGSRNYSQCRHIPGCFSSVSEYVTGTKGHANVGGHTLVDFKGKLLWRHDGKANKDPYQVEHDRLFDAVRNNKPHNEAVNGAMSTMTSILGRLATYTGRRLTWDQAFNSKIVMMPDDIDYVNGTWTGTPPSKPNANGEYPIAVPGSEEWMKRLV